MLLEVLLLGWWWWWLWVWTQWLLLLLPLFTRRRCNCPYVELPGIVGAVGEDLSIPYTLVDILLLSLSLQSNIKWMNLDFAISKIEGRFLFIINIILRIFLCMKNIHHLKITQTSHQKSSKYSKMGGKISLHEPFANKYWKNGFETSTENYLLGRSSRILSLNIFF